jgi:hypothetical protein
MLVRKVGKKKRNAYRLLRGKPKGKRPLGRPRRRWVDNIKMELGEIRRGGVESTCEFCDEPPVSV